MTPTRQSQYDRLLHLDRVLREEQALRTHVAYDEDLAANRWWSKQSPYRRAHWLTVADGPLSAWREMVKRKGRLPRVDSIDGRET